AALYVWKYGNPFKNIAAATNLPAGARFISLEGDVRVIRSSTRESIAANSQTQLYPGDTVQTQADGRARITLADGSTLVVRPNSTVIVRDNTSGDDGHKTNVRVAVDRGQINVRTEDQAEGTRNVVETPKTQNQLAAQTGATFGVNPEEQTEEIRVGAGQIQTVTSNGEQTVIRAGDYVAVNPSGTLGPKQKLLDVPVPVSPRDVERIFVSANGAANVTLRWQRPAVGTPAQYRVEVATSPFFVAEGKVIERDQLVATEFNATDLRPGVYFWHVRARAGTGQMSDWSEPLKFMVAPQGTGDQVPVSNLSAQYLGGNVYLIRGQAPPGTTIRVSGRETLTDSREAFQLQIAAGEGVREAMIEAHDTQGNRSQYKVALSRGG
ncbi:MAG TPA: FecR domain-containing protein, partial [Pyrinomonadaceae bacterium]|nr:FecR domain-containing protein [Pyrinomonadaceae bacterium]